MNTSKRHRALTVMLASLLLPTAAGARSYTYVEGGFLERDARGGDDAGFRMAGAADMAAAPPLVLFGEFADTGDFDQLTAGALLYTLLNPGLEGTAGASLEVLDTGNGDDTGLGLRAGLRWVLAPQKFEINPEVRHITGLFNQSVTSLRLAGLVQVDRRLDVQAAVQSGDDDRLELGMRFNFGQGGNRLSRPPGTHYSQ